MVLEVGEMEGEQFCGSCCERTLNVDEVVFERRIHCGSVGSYRGCWPMLKPRLVTRLNFANTYEVHIYA